MTTHAERRTEATRASNHKSYLSDGPSVLGTAAESDVVAACQRGESPAQRRLFDTHRHEVFRLVHGIVGSADAADLLQQVFLQVFRAIGQFDGSSRFETWLYRLAVNECLQHLRRRRRRPTVVLDHDPMDQVPSHERETEYRELFEQALQRLEPELRAIFLLRETERLSYAEIAEALSISQGTVASRLNRARHHLKQILVELGWEP